MLDLVKMVCLRIAHNLHTLARKGRGGVEYWRGAVFGGNCGGASGGKVGGSGVKFHGGNPPKAARYALAIDHEGARFKAHLSGRFGPSSFVLTGEQIMLQVNGSMVRAGYVRAVWSERCRGHALPAALVKANLRGAAALAWNRAVCVEAQDAELRAVEMRGRVAAHFADYLVSDHEPAFSECRDGWQSAVDTLCSTGGKVPLCSEYRDDAGGPLDAPDCSPAGACDSIWYLFGGAVQCQMTVVRGAWVEPEPEPFAAGRAVDCGPDYVCLTGARSQLAGLRDAEGYALDAPEYLAAGCVFEHAGGGSWPKISSRGFWL